MSIEARTAHGNHLKAVAKVNLQGYPKVMLNYLDESAGKQMTSKSVLTNTVRRLVDYLVDECEIDLSDRNCWKDVSTRDIKDFIKSCKYRTLKDGTVKELKPKTLKDYLSAIQNFFNYLTREGLIEKSPCPSLDDMDGIIGDAVEEREIVYMTPDEVKKAVMHIQRSSKAPKRDVCILMIGCTTGARAEALAEIDLSDINFDTRKITITDKGNHTRRVLLDKYVLQQIRECIDERGDVPGTNALFVKERCGVTDRISKRHIARLMEGVGEAIGKHITPHKMRATCATVTYERKHDIYATATRVGHSSVRSTQYYINTDKTQSEVADDLGEVFFA